MDPTSALSGATASQTAAPGGASFEETMQQLLADLMPGVLGFVIDEMKEVATEDDSGA